MLSLTMHSSQHFMNTFKAIIEEVIRSLEDQFTNVERLLQQLTDIISQQLNSDITI